jgi:hypothetical protein
MQKNVFIIIYFISFFEINSRIFANLNCNQIFIAEKIQVSGTGAVPNISGIQVLGSSSGKKRNTFYQLNNGTVLYLKAPLFISGIEVRTAFLRRTLIPGIN